MEKSSREESVELLKNKNTEISERGENRFPRRSDFTDYEVMTIKAHLGPWPRALEAAGLKAPREKSRLELNREKRNRLKNKASK